MFFGFVGVFLVTQLTFEDIKNHFSSCVWPPGLPFFHHPRRNFSAGRHRQVELTIGELSKKKFKQQFEHLNTTLYFLNFFQITKKILIFFPSIIFKCLYLPLGNTRDSEVQRDPVVTRDVAQDQGGGRGTRPRPVGMSFDLPSGRKSCSRGIGDP